MARPANERGEARRSDAGIAFLILDHSRTLEHFEQFLGGFASFRGPQHLNAIEDVSQEEIASDVTDAGLTGVALKRFGAE
jgi:hypothetical protein